MKIRLVSPRQQGSTFFSLVVLVVIGFAVWHFGRDRVRNMFASDEGKPKAHVELIDFGCERSGPMGIVKGSVRNPSTAPMKLVVMVLVKRADLPPSRESVRVEPSPLPPGETGNFKVEALAVDEKDECRVTGFLDDGQRIDYSGKGSR